MSVEEVRDRRGRAARGRSGLLERDAVLARLEAAMEAAAAGSGEALLYIGYAGMGKTRLHEAALDAARARGFIVLRGAGAELEVELPFGVAGQMIRSGLRQLDSEHRESLLATAPPVVRSLAGLETVEPEVTGGLTVVHGLFRLIAAIAERKPVLLAVDDVHWCDEPSLDFLLYVLHRVHELSGVVLMTLRSGGGTQHSREVDTIISHPRVTTVQLAPLGRKSIAELLRRALPEQTDERLLDTCAEITAGNPFYLHELLLALEDEAQDDPEKLVERARSLAPDAVTRSLRVRVGRLGEDAGRLARAVAVLGDDVPMRHAAALAHLGMDEAVAAADALASVEVLLAREPLRFVHPLVRHAVEKDIPASELASRHLEAARLLHADHAPAGRIAAHLLLGRPQGDPWAVEQLRTAARDAMSGSAPSTAVSLLRRALAEPPDAESRVVVLGELGIAEAAAGLPEAASRLAAAAEASSDPAVRAALALERGHALRRQGRQKHAADAYQAGLRDLEAAGPAENPEPHDALHDELQSGFLGAGSMVTALQAETIRQAPELIERLGEHPRSHGHRLLLAHAAMNAAFAGEPAGAVAGLAERAWAGGDLLDHETPDGMGWSRVSGAFCLAGQLERAVEVADAARSAAQELTMPLAFATASYFRSIPLLWQGNVLEAFADLEQARDAQRFGWRHFTRGAAAQYALCLLERDDVHSAERVLAEEPLGHVRDVEDCMRVFALAEVRLAQGRAADALQVALRAGQEMGGHVLVLGYTPWRITAAKAALAAGKQGQAIELSEAALEMAQRTEVPHSQIAALRSLGIAQGGEKGLERLHEAVALAGALPPRLEGIRARVELGAALRRANRRSDARAELVEVADAAHQAGLVALHRRARTELAAAGARPRREMILVGPEALTPSERRIASLAASGQSNREIAQALFVTPKTVEYHLRNVYRKLGINARQELARALRG